VPEGEERKTGGVRPDGIPVVLPARPRGATPSHAAILAPRTRIPQIGAVRLARDLAREDVLGPSSQLQGSP